MQNKQSKQRTLPYEQHTSKNCVSTPNIQPHHSCTLQQYVEAMIDHYAVPSKMLPHVAAHCQTLL